jgi:hypothetical protein
MLHRDFTRVAVWKTGRDGEGWECLPGFELDSILGSEAAGLVVTKTVDFRGGRYLLARLARGGE